MCPHCDRTHTGALGHDRGQVGCNSLGQGLWYYISEAKQLRDNHTRLYHKTCLPMMLMEVSGVHLHFSGLALGEAVLCEHFLSLTAMCEEPHVQAVATALQALDQMLAHVHQMHGEAAATASPARGMARLCEMGFPEHLRRTYPGAVFGRPTPSSKLLFSVAPRAGGPTTLVKFIRAGSDLPATVQQEFANIKLAPNVVGRAASGEIICTLRLCTTWVCGVVAMSYFVVVAISSLYFALFFHPPLYLCIFCWGIVLFFF